MVRYTDWTLIISLRIFTAFWNKRIWYIFSKKICKINSVVFSIPDEPSNTRMFLQGRETLQAVSNYSFKGRISRPVTTYQRSEIWYSKSPITIAVAGHLMIVGHFHVTWFHVLSDSILKRKESKLASPRPFMLFITVFVGREFISFAIICMQVLACVLAPFFDQ